MPVVKKRLIIPAYSDAMIFTALHHALWVENKRLEKCTGELKKGQLYNAISAAPISISFVDGGLNISDRFFVSSTTRKRMLLMDFVV